jgi:hypothetical protein
VLFVGDSVLERVQVLIDAGLLQELLGARLDQLRPHLHQLAFGLGRAVSSRLLLPQRQRQLLLGVATTASALDLVERAHLGQRGVGSSQLDLEVLHPPPRTEQGHRITASRASLPAAETSSAGL